MNEISRQFAIKLLQEVKTINQELIKEITKNNDLINSLKEIYNIDDADNLKPIFSNNLSKAKNIPTLFHKYDHVDCDLHDCIDCVHEDKKNYQSPCNECSVINETDTCAYEEEGESDNYNESDYEELFNQREENKSIYEPLSNLYLELHNGNDCKHSSSSCKDCKFNSIKADSVPCIGCKCSNENSKICFFSKWES